MLARWSGAGVPRLTSSAPATPASSSASPGTSAIAGDAPTASSAFATRFVVTTLVTHWTSGVVARSRASASAAAVARPCALRGAPASGQAGTRADVIG
jgi:hypothetical protein